MSRHNSILRVFTRHATALRTRVLSACAVVIACAAPSFAGGPPPPPQVIVLDFDTYNKGEATDHDYTPEEREQILTEMSGHFMPLGVVIAPTPPPDPPFSTVYFNAETAGGSEGVDLRNLDESDVAWVNARMMLAVVGIAEVDMTSEMIVRASINVGIHEALHLLGVRHPDAFAPPGVGLSFAGLVDEYDPFYPGPAGASISGKTFESLTLTFGLSAAKLLQDDMFISPRSAMKVLLGTTGMPATPQVPGNISPLDAQMVMPTTFVVPNTLPADLEWPPSLPPLPDCVDVTDLKFIATVSIVTGDLFDPPFNPPNYYKFPTDLPPGPMLIPPSFTIEVFSEVLEHRLTPIDTALYVLDPGPPIGPGFLPVDYYGEGAHNKHGIEGGDPAIFDLLPPPFPAFIIEVAPEEPPDLAGGEYELIVYSLGVFVPPCTLAGDFNCDGMVDETDRAMLCAALGSEVGERAFLCVADFNLDGVIDHADLHTFNNLLPVCDGDIVTSATFTPPPDGITDGADLAFLLGAWGAQPSCADMVTTDTFQPPPDGTVDGADLAFQLGAWGSCR